jgi:hypothetical protein
MYCLYEFVSLKTLVLAMELFGTVVKSVQLAEATVTNAAPKIMREVLFMSGFRLVGE